MKQRQTTEEHSRVVIAKLLAELGLALDRISDLEAEKLELERKLSRIESALSGGKSGEQ